MLADGELLPFLYVRDWSAARSFYVGTLGLEWQQQTADWVMVATSSGTRCALLSEAKRHETSAVHRAGLFLMIPADLAGILDRLSAGGVAIVRQLQRFSHGAEAAIADPDGNVIVLYEATHRS